jgi:hypothetical protein
MLWRITKDLSFVQRIAADCGLTAVPDREMVALDT